MAEVTKVSSWARNDGPSSATYCSASMAVSGASPASDMAACSIASRARSSRSTGGGLLKHVGRGQLDLAHLGAERVVAGGHLIDDRVQPDDLVDQPDQGAGRG